MKNRFLGGSLIFFALTSLVGCADELDPGSRVNTLRVLAQQMDAPYAAPGEAVHVSSLAFDPQGRSLEWAWAACVNPSSSEVTGCLEKLAVDSASSGAPPLLARGPDVSSVDLTVPSDALTSLPEAARESASVGVLSIACPGTLSFEGATSGLPFVCSERDTGRKLGLDEFVAGVKRVVVRERDRNTNPLIARVTFDGLDWPEELVQEVDVCPESGNDIAACSENLRHRLAAEPAAESFEAGLNEFGKDFSEQLIVQYFATEGIFEEETRIGASPETKWVARQQAAGTEVTFWMVVRDNRGGVSWTSRRVRVR